MQEVLCKNINGAIILIDSIKGITETDEEIMNFIEEKNVPYVIFANKQDLDGKIQIDTDNVPVIPTVATTCHGIFEGLNILLELIEKNELFGNIQIACTS
jgi:signal recognition particle receptor subunit beta